MSGSRALAGVRVGVIVSDTFGRAWRMGLVNVALGVAGIPAVLDYRGRPDDFGMPLQATVVAVADELAAAAELLMGKTRRVPAVDRARAGRARGAARAPARSWYGRPSSTLSGEGGAALRRHRRRPAGDRAGGVLPPDDLSIVVNTADDDEFWGLLVSPDVDAILYRLAGVFNDATGFGVRDDTFQRAGDAREPWRADLVPARRSGHRRAPA